MVAELSPTFFIRSCFGVAGRFPMVYYGIPMEKSEDLTLPVPRPFHEKTYYYRYVGGVPIYWVHQSQRIRHGGFQALAYLFRRKEVCPHDCLPRSDHRQDYGVGIIRKCSTLPRETFKTPDSVACSRRRWLQQSRWNAPSEN